MCASIRSKKTSSNSATANVEIYVSTEIIINVLNKFHDGKVDAQWLIEWASFLLSNDVYVTEGWEDDDKADRYEPMWNVLQRLSTPFLDGSITDERVSAYIEELASLNN